MGSGNKSFKERVHLSSFSQIYTTKQHQAVSSSVTRDTYPSSSSQPCTTAAKREDRKPGDLTRADDSRTLLSSSSMKNASVEHEQNAQISEIPNDNVNSTEPSLQDAAIGGSDTMVDGKLTGNIREQLEQAAKQREFWSNQYEILKATYLADNEDTTTSIPGRRRQNQKRQREVARCVLCRQFEQLSQAHDVVHAALTNEYESLLAEHNNLVVEHEKLTDHCNQLTMQNSRGQPLNPSEENIRAIQDFRQLNHGIRTWCLKLKDIQPKALCKFDSFPLANNSAVCISRKPELYLSKACVWEWLLRYVFGTVHDLQKQPIVDLWTDSETAQCLNHLENQVAASQSKEALFEWRSFTVQSLTPKKDCYDKDRVSELASRIVRWFLQIFGHTDFETTTVQKLCHNLVVQVIIPAIKFQHLSRQTRSSISVSTPFTIEDAISNHSSIEDGSRPALEVVVEPELKRLNYPTGGENKIRETVLTQAFRYTIVESQLEQANHEEQEEVQGDLGPPTATHSRPPSSYPSQSMPNPPIHRKVTDPWGANKSKVKGWGLSFMGIGS